MPAPPESQPAVARRAGRVRPSAAVAVAVSAACGVGLLAVLVALHPPGSFDRSVLAEVHARPGSGTSGLARLVTTIGDGVPLFAVLSALAGAAWARWRSWVPLLVPALALAMAAAASTVLKPVIGRERPPVSGWLVSADGNSFPSGHTTAATAGYLGLGLAVAGLAATVLVRVLSVVAGIAMAVAVGWTRVELGVHWPTDVAAGWALGLVAVCAALVLLPFMPLAAAGFREGRGG